MADQQGPTIKYHLECPYHSDLPVFDSEQDAHQGAAEHITKRHADQNGRVADNAEVTIRPVMHFTANDAKQFQSQQQPPKQNS